MKGSSFALLLFLSFTTGEYSFDNMKKITHVLKPGQERRILSNESNFQMFCRIGDHKYVSYYFRTPMLRIISSAEDIRLVKGNSPKEVYLQHKSQGKLLWWLANKLPWRARDTHFPTFNTSCVGIQSSQGYTAALIIKPIDPWKVLTFLGGVSLYILAPNLSRSTLFFYSSGTLIGGLAAALVLLFVVSRFLPKSVSGKGVMVFMWTVAFYFAGETYKKLEDLVQEKMHYIVVYLVVGGLVALLVCYRWGPPQHPRTLNVIRWALQLFGLVLIHFSSDFVEMSTAFILLLLSYSHFRPAIIYHCENFYYRWFPSKRRLLTEEEYITQGAVETEKGLEELKKFCSSPEANPWKLVSRLKNPRRFSSFMSGSSHLSDDEVLGYEAIELDDNDRRGLLTDDSGDEDSFQINNSQNHLETTDDES